MYCTFERQGSPGELVEVAIHEIVRLTKVSGPGTQTVTENLDLEAVPENLRPYAGEYLLAQVGAKFKVVHRDGGLAVYDPLAKKEIGLQPPDEHGRFVDEFNKNTISFERNDAGVEVRALVIDAVSRFRR